MFAIMITFSLLMALAITIYTDTVVMKLLQDSDDYDELQQDLLNHAVDNFTDYH